VILLKEAHPLEESLGMEFYSTDFNGVGGKIKTRFEDFIVEEISSSGDTLEVIDWQAPREEIKEIEKKAKFTRFVVQKMGLSTMDAAHIIAAELKISRNLITYAGLKDKRAITVQTMSGPARIAEPLRSLDLSRILIRDIQQSRTSVQIGDLWGNRFQILLRDIGGDCTAAMDLAQIIRDSVLLNYFGVQRFGVTRPTTHLVGRALAKRDFEEAVRIMLATLSGYENAELERTRLKLAEDLTPTQEMIDSFPKELGYERDVMKHLASKPGDYERAISRIPARVQTLFVHAYQSYLFNRLISRRRLQGLSIREPEIGDFIIALNEAHSGRDSWLYVTESTLDERREQVETGQYGLAAPVFGYSTRMPPSRQSDLVRDILMEENIRLMDFRNSKNRALDSPGGLHLVSLQVPDLQASCSDEGLLLKFSLRKGSYATVVLREIMKNDPINRV
jgi:tRNA pseudouridine13 synthase